MRRRILIAGVAVGVLDLLDAVVFFGLRYDVPPIRIFHSIAAGLLGRDEARAGGWPTAALGILLHFVIAFGVVTTYALVAGRARSLLRRPVPLGVAYGLVVYAVMNYVVLPLSAVPPRAGLPPWDILVNGLLAHVFCVGLPTTLILSRR